VWDRKAGEVVDEAELLDLGPPESGPHQRRTKNQAQPSVKDECSHIRRRGGSVEAEDPAAGIGDASFTYRCIGSESDRFGPDAFDGCHRDPAAMQQVDQSAW
jgi:hypothetical protein